MTREEIEDLIREHYGFIISVVSNTTGRYVNVDSDDAFSIGLLAFQEACEKYDPQRGSFLAFVKVVIRSRVLDHLRRENREQHDSVEAMEEEGEQFSDSSSRTADLRMEIEAWKQELADFKITIPLLVEEAPKHQDTKDQAVWISERSSQHEPITVPMFQKKRLPIKRTADYNGVSEKVIRRSKTYITSLIIVFKRQFKAIISWAKGGGKQ